MIETTGDDGMEVVDLRFESLRDLQDDFGPFLSTEGFFLAGRIDFSVSDVLRFRLMLPGDFVLIEGLGVVGWVRETAGPKTPPGVAVGFATLSDQGRELVERIVHSHLESGGKPFDMSRRSENGESQDSQSGQIADPEPSSSPGSMKFTVRDDSLAEPSDQPEGDDELRLPFEADIEPEVLTSEIVEPDDSVADEASPAVFEQIADPGGDFVQPELQQGLEESSTEALFADPVEPGVADSEPVPSEGSEELSEQAVEVGIEPDPEFDPQADFEPEREPEPEAQFESEIEIAGEPGFEPEFQSEPEDHYESEPTLEDSNSSLEISLPDNDVTMPDQPDSWARDEVTFDTDNSAKAKGRSGLIWVVAAVVILAAGAWVIWSLFPQFLPWGGLDSDGDTIEAGATTVVDVPLDPIAALSDEDLEAAVVAAVDAVTSSEKVEEVESVEPEPVPTEAPAIEDPVSGPASRIVEIKTEAIDGGTVVLIRGDGVFQSGRIATSLLLNPARVLVRISGIDSPYRPYVIPVGNSEVEEIRVGHHEETRPPSLWIVLDRSDESVEIRNVQTSGNVVRVEVGR